MSLPRYSKYKDSGVAWLGDVPKHWEVRRFKQMLSEALMYGANEAADSDTPENPRFVRITDITDTGKLREDTFRSLPPEVANPYLLTDGDILLARSGATVGKSFIYRDSWGQCCFAGYLIKARTNPKVAVSDYLYASLQADFYWQYIAREQIQATIQNVSAEKYGEFIICCPPLAEQTAIAAFLDHETTKIDGLVAEQEKLIALLAEKRQATISHAVTKGLNPDAPMKDSGVAWLGEMPAHWEVKPLKHIVVTPITDGPHETPAFGDEGVPFVSAEAVSAGHINFDKIRGHISRAEHERFSLKYLPRLHDIYMVKSGATTGVTAIVETTEEFNIWSPLAAIRCNQEIANPYFALNFLRSRNFQEAVTLNWSFGTQQNIGMGVLGDLQVSLPPLPEQQDIANLLNAETARLDALTSEATRGIALLKERRSALISAAVTGKIDVRHLAEQKAA